MSAASGMRRVVILPRAVDDIETRYIFVAHQNPAAAVRFLAKFLETRGTLADNPAFGPMVRSRLPRLRGLRRCSVIGFRSMQVVYRLDGETVEIIRVLHGSQDLRRAVE